MFQDPNGKRLTPEGTDGRTEMEEPLHLPLIRPDPARSACVLTSVRVKTDVSPPLASSRAPLETLETLFLSPKVCVSSAACSQSAGLTSIDCSRHPALYSHLSSAELTLRYPGLPGTGAFKGLY